VRFAGPAGRIVLDRLRTVDKTRLIRELGRIRPPSVLIGATIVAAMWRFISSGETIEQGRPPRIPLLTVRSRPPR
jgi:hypothetical protein